MSIDSVVSEIIDARLCDIALAKKYITTARSDLERQYQFQCTILTIYASLEGGVKDIVGVLMRSINTTECNINDLTPCYATLALSKFCKLDQAINDHQKKIKTTENIVTAFSNRARLPIFIDTESNLSPQVIKKICLTLALPSVITSSDDENSLNILLRFRNNIAHGDRRMPIDFPRIDQLSGVAIRILCLMGLKVSEAHEKKVWLTRAINTDA